MANVRRVNTGDPIDETDGMNYRQSRWDAQRRARGIIAETHLQQSMAGPIGPGTSGTLYCMQVWLVAGDTIANMSINVGAAAVAETFAKGGLYDTSGNLLASTADQGAGWGTTGIHTTAFTVAYPVVTTGIYYAGVLILAGTLPTIGGMMAGISTRIGLTAPIAGKPLLFWSIAGLADLPNPAAIAAGAAPSLLWIGLS